MNRIGIILLMLATVSCGVSNRKEAEAVIARFEQNQVPDKRETVFDVEASFQKGKVILQGETDNENLKNELLNQFQSFEVVDEITILPDSTVGEKTYALVNVSAANFRATPRYSSELVTQALLGTPAKILKKQGGWHLVQTPDRYISWAPSGGIFPVTKTELQNLRQADRIIFTGSFSQIYESEKQEKPIGDVTMGGILERLEQQGNYIKVRFPDGREGFTTQQSWVSFSEFRETMRPDSSSLVNLAQSMKGRPYLWGGTSALAMDCSGFTKMVYFMHGIILARDASLQVRHGQFVNPDESFENLQPGDLLFFGQKANEEQPERITHVAISLGKAEYIHAAGKVAENSFDPQSKIYSKYRKNTFISARRVIGSEGTEGIQWVRVHPWY
ncbi:NlpC/P60 family protein [Mariniphaga sp.]|uniref:C40 family peptidase n=1 Tax=Mariniphaga sp. TaxID=1954475 RepID=UPI00356778EE